LPFFGCNNCIDDGIFEGESTAQGGFRWREGMLGFRMDNFEYEVPKKCLWRMLCVDLKLKV
jgi:hypothetical protein